MHEHILIYWYNPLNGENCSRDSAYNRRLQVALAHMLDHPVATDVAELFKALSDPTRIRLVSLLAEAELCVRDIATALDMSQSAVSHQLRTLRSMRLVRWRREGRRIFYTLDDEHVVDLYRRGLEHVLHE